MALPGLRHLQLLCLPPVCSTKAAQHACIPLSKELAQCGHACPHNVGPGLSLTRVCSVCISPWQWAPSLLSCELLPGGSEPACILETGRTLQWHFRMRAAKHGAVLETVLWSNQLALVEQPTAWQGHQIAAGQVQCEPGAPRTVGFHWATATGCQPQSQSLPAVFC